MIEDDNSEDLVPTAKQALDALKTINHYLQFNNHDEINMTSIEQLERKIQLSILEKTKKQKKITDYM